MCCIFSFVFVFLFLIEYVDFGWCAAFENIELEVLAGNDAILSEFRLNRLSCQLRVVVLFREMCQPYVLERW